MRDLKELNNVLDGDEAVPNTQANLDDLYNKADASDVRKCMNCFFASRCVSDEPCDGCFCRSKWVVADETYDTPAPVVSLHDTLYRQGCWVSLQNRLHDLMSEWSLLAADCNFQNLDYSCDHHSEQKACYFSNCPRIHGA